MKILRKMELGREMKMGREMDMLRKTGDGEGRNGEDIVRRKW